MSRLRFVQLRAPAKVTAAAAALMLLSGCVAYGPGYGPGYAYAAPAYYAPTYYAPAPAVVGYGGWWGGGGRGWWGGGGRRWR